MLATLYARKNYRANIDIAVPSYQLLGYCTVNIYWLYLCFLAIY